jgi:hypothetical protein
MCTSSIDTSRATGLALSSRVHWPLLTFYLSEKGCSGLGMNDMPFQVTQETSDKQQATADEEEMDAKEWRREVRFRVQLGQTPGT